MIDTNSKPIGLLKPIKEHFLCFEELHYEISALLDSSKNFLVYKKKEESIIDFARRLQIAQEVLKSYLDRETVLRKHAKDQPTHDENDQ